MSKKWCENSGRATCSPYASDNAACTQRPDRAPAKNRKRLLKIFGASGLAIMMGASVLCGVLITPMNSAQANAGATSASNKGALAALAQTADSAQSQGLITPKEDDPVIGTTESGLEIKYGNALTGNLAGFPYFVTNDGTTDYYWVIIGAHSKINGASLQFVPDNPENYLELNSPAGKAIAKDNFLIWRMISERDDGSGVSAGLAPVNPKSELSAGQILCLANTAVATAVKNNSASDWVSIIGSIGVSLFHSTYDGTMATAFDNYLTAGSEQFGLGAISSYIQTVSLTTTGVTYNTGVTTTTSSHKIFTLSGIETDTFYYLNYLTETQASTGATWWLRGGNSTTHDATISTQINMKKNGGYYGQYVNESGGISTASVSSSTAGYRPAFVLKL